MTSRKESLRTSVALARRSDNQRAVDRCSLHRLAVLRRRQQVHRQPGGGGGQGGGRGGRGGGALYTPAAGAKDLKSVLFNWAWHMGMLRSSEEYDLMMSLEYQGNGTMQVDGQPCNVTKYRTSISYQTSGERIQITGTRPNGAELLQCRSPQWRLHLERRHSRCRTRPGQRQSHSDAGNRRGADDSPVGQSAGCVEGRNGRGLRPTSNGGQTATDTSRCHDGR